jgi:hypothetical protein
VIFLTLTDISRNHTQSRRAKRETEGAERVKERELKNAKQEAFRKEITGSLHALSNGGLPHPTSAQEMVKVLGFITKVPPFTELKVFSIECIADYFGTIVSMARDRDQSKFLVHLGQMELTVDPHAVVDFSALPESHFAISACLMNLAKYA